MLRPVLLVIGITAIGATACSASAVPATPGRAEVRAPQATLAAAVAPPAGPTVTASGEGTAYGAPDLLTVTLGVQTNGRSAHDVLETNNTEATAMLAKLRADGVAPTDVQTVELGLNPVYDGPGHLTGYQATDTVTVRVHQLDRAGALIDDAVAAGGGDSQVQSVSYSVQDPGPLVAAAHADAVRQAVAEAKAMAAAAGTSLGSLEAVSDTAAPQVLPYAAAAPAMGSSAGQSAVPVQAGTEQVTADVTVTYALA